MEIVRFSDGLEYAVRSWGESLISVILARHLGGSSDASKDSCSGRCLASKNCPTGTIDTYRTPVDESVA